jgi:hypothetical protein
VGRRENCVWEGTYRRGAGRVLFLAQGSRFKGIYLLYSGRSAKKGARLKQGGDQFGLSNMQKTAETAERSFLYSEPSSIISIQ